MPRSVIARWESRRGKDWVEVYEQTLSPSCVGYGYEFRNGSGWFGNFTREQALAEVQRRVASGHFCSQKSPMRKVV
jgi:hypothetical protein